MMADDDESQNTGPVIWIAVCGIMGGGWLAAGALLAVLGWLAVVHVPSALRSRRLRREGGGKQDKDRDDPR